MNKKLMKQLDFIIEVDKLKNIFRQSYIADTSRRENDAEHSWHLALMAVILSEYVKEDIDIKKVLKMLLIHDLVEIYAGDTFAFDETGYEDKEEREINAATELFYKLPENQGKEFMDLWLEFEKGENIEAKYAAMMDRLQPLILDYATEGKGVIESNLTRDQLLKRNEISLNDGPKEIKELVNYLLDNIFK